MNQLLKFFLPKLVYIFKIFVSVLLIGISLKLLPLDKESRDFSEMIVFIIFPFWSFFNKKLYIPSNLNWILLTPIKSKDIILSNAILNIIKIIIISSLMILYSLLLHRTQLIELLPTKSNSEDFVRFPTAAIAVFLLGFHVIAAFLFTLMPDYQAAQRERMDYRPPKINPKEIVQIILLIGVVLWSLGNPFVQLLLSVGVVFTPLVLMFLIFTPVKITLQSLRLYHHKKTLYVIAAGSFFFYFFILFYSARSNIGSPTISSVELLSERDFLGIYGSHLRPQIINRLKQVDASSIKLRSDKINNVLTWTSKDEQDDLLRSWEDQCQKKKDHSCRFAGYIYDQRKDQKKALELAQMSCPTDLQSCIIVLFSPVGTDKERELAEHNLAQGCTGKKQDERVVCCTCLEEYRAQKEKIKSDSKPKD